MELLSEELRKLIPSLYATENIPFEKKIIHTKFYTPDSDWTWYVAEFDGEDTFFGFVEGHHNEWGYFSLEELQQGRGPWGLGIERDIYWEQKTIGYRLHKFEKCNNQNGLED